MTTINVPLALRRLIERNTEDIRVYKEQLESEILVANREIMTILGLSADEGWRLDMSTMTYVKLDKPTDAPVDK